MRLSHPLFLSSSLLALFLAACGQTAAPAAAPDSSSPTPGEMVTVQTHSPDDPSGVPAEPTGPMAAQNRVVSLRIRTMSKDNQAITSEVDLGNAEVGGFRTPVRGSLVLPVAPTGKLPLIVVNHLRAPNCSDSTFAYPCPEGTTEHRADRGMRYLGEHLAKAGYATLIPDLGGVWIGPDAKDPYDQNTMWEQVVIRLVDAIHSDVQGTTNHFDLNNLDAIDAQRIGLVVHSRSGTIVDQAISTFGQDRIKGVLAYGPAYDTLDAETFSPTPADVPYLGIFGEADADVGPSANLWLGEYLSTNRQTPMMVTSVPGLGHMFINRAYAEAELDDRHGCDLMDCPDAQEHERILTQVSTDWFTRVLPGKQAPAAEASALPLSPDTPLPDTIAGVEARWLVATHGKGVTHLAPKDFKGVGKDTALHCRHADPMNPVPIDNACPEPEQGAVQLASEVLHFTDAVASLTKEDARVLAIHLSPVDRPKGKDGGVPLTVKLTMNNHTSWDHTVDAKHPALRNRASAHDNGIYRLGTIRIPLPESVSNQVVTKVELSAPQPLALRAIDLAT